MGISRKENILCGWCYNKSTLGEWNDLTWSRCTNREMKRAFTPLTEKKAFMCNSESYYECPVCHKWSSGNQLKIVDTDNKELKRLGGKPIQELVSGENIKNANNDNK